MKIVSMGGDKYDPPARPPVRIVPVAAALAGAAVIAYALLPGPGPDAPEEGIVHVGAIIPLSGDLSSMGADILVSTRFAVDEVNGYLGERGRDWRMALAVEDSTTRPVTALDKISALKARGIDLVLGPLSSAEVRHVKGYADSNGMVIVSCCSNAPSLAVPGDSVFRMNQDHSHLGPALARLLEHDGIRAAVPVWRGDTWGDGLHGHFAGAFDGVVDDGIRYVPDAPDFAAAASLLAGRVGDLVDEHGADAVAILFIGFDEATIFFQTSSDYGVLGDVRWYGTNANAGRSRLLDDPVASQFAGDVRFTAMQVASGGSPAYERIRAHALSELGRTPPAYVYSSYDAAWVMALAIDEAGTDPAAVREAIPRAAASYVGALGDIRLNEAGDLTGASYQVISIVDGAWEVVGTHEEGGPVVITG